MMAAVFNQRATGVLPFRTRSSFRCHVFKKVVPTALAVRRVRYLKHGVRPVSDDLEIHRFSPVELRPGHLAHFNLLPFPVRTPENGFEFQQHIICLLIAGHHFVRLLKLSDRRLSRPP